MSNASHITVATIVEKDGAFLFVEERVNGELVLNQPAGHWEENETLYEGALRETLEETGWEVELTGLVGIYEFKPADLDFGFLRFAFAAKAVRHHPQRPLDDGIVRAVWFTRDQLIAHPCHRSPMVVRCVDDFRSGRRLPLDVIGHLTPR